VISLEFVVGREPFGAAVITGQYFVAVSMMYQQNLAWLRAYIEIYSARRKDARGRR